MSHQSEKRLFVESEPEACEMSNDANRGFVLNQHVAPLIEMRFAICSYDLNVSIQLRVLELETVGSLVVRHSNILDLPSLMRDEWLGELNMERSVVHQRP
jgi:hypothetical protein